MTFDTPFEDLEWENRRAEAGIPLMLELDLDWDQEPVERVPDQNRGVFVVEPEVVDVVGAEEEV